MLQVSHFAKEMLRSIMGNEERNSCRRSPVEAEAGWVASAKPTSYPSFQGSVHAQTVVIGAGIVGLTTA